MVARPQHTADLSPVGMKKRAEFLSAARGVFVARPAFTVQSNTRSDDKGASVGFTATKKLGKAVIRNRARRRLREVVRHVAPGLFQQGRNYVVLARPDVLTRRFDTLCFDMETALKKIAKGEAHISKPRHTQRSKR